MRRTATTSRARDHQGIVKCIVTPTALQTVFRRAQRKTFTSNKIAYRCSSCSFDDLHGLSPCHVFATYGLTTLLPRKRADHFRKMMHPFFIIGILSITRIKTKYILYLRVTDRRFSWSNKNS